MTGGIQIAVLLACHDRRETTLACLRRLFAQEQAEGLAYTLETFLVDDGSSDGTTEAVHSEFPCVRVLPGDGGLFWCGGMRLAFAAALEIGGFDHYLWLNDDILLRPDALRRLLACHDALVRRRPDRPPPIVVGSCADPATGDVTYGGLRRLGPLPFTRLVQPGEEPVATTTMNGNLVLIPAAVAEAAGNLDPQLVHLRGDVDYGLRARRAGCEVWVAPGIFAECEPNPIGRWRDARLPLGERLASIREPKYALAEKILVARRHYGPLWFLSPVALYGYVFLSHLWARIAGRARRSAKRDV